MKNRIKTILLPIIFLFQSQIKAQDIGVAYFVTPTPGQSITSGVIFNYSIVVKNYGTQAISSNSMISVRKWSGYSSPVLNTFGPLANALNSGDSISLSGTSGINITGLYPDPPNGTWHYKIYTVLASDIDHTNDTATIVLNFINTFYTNVEEKKQVVSGLIYCNGKVTVQLTDASELANNLIISVYDLSGRLVKTDALLPFASGASEPVDYSGIQSGLYIVSISSGYSTLFSTKLYLTELGCR